MQRLEIFLALDEKRIFMTLIIHCKVIQGQVSFCVINISLEALKVHFTSVSFKTVDDYLYFIID